jgi:hypothetical protein
LKDNESEEGYRMVMDCRKYLHLYNNFASARNLGVMFRPGDLDYEHFLAFEIIEKRLKDLESKKHG